MVRRQGKIHVSEPKKSREYGELSYGALKNSRFSRLVKYKKIRDEHKKVLQIIIDRGPICDSFVAAFAGLPLEKTREIIKDLKDKMRAIEIYTNGDRPDTTGELYYYCPHGM